MRYVECTFIRLYADISTVRTLLATHDGFHVPRSTSRPTANPNNQDKVPTNTVFYVHGGGFCVHTATEKIVASEVIKLYSNCKFYLCDYPLCPQVSASQIFQHCLKQYEKVHASCDGNVVIMGDSAGGNIALSLKLHSQSTNSFVPKGCVLLSPWIDVHGTSPLASFSSNRSTDYMSAHFVKAFQSLTLSGSSGDVPTLEDILSRSSDLSDTLIVTGGGELMADENVALWLASGGSGGTCEIHVGDEAPHDFVMSRAFCKEGVFEEAWRVVATRCRVFFGDFEEEGGEEWVEVELDEGEGEEEESEEEEEEEEEPDEKGYEHVKRFVDEVLKRQKRKTATKKKAAKKMPTKTPTKTSTIKRRASSRKRATK
ncbi:hypothetical protein TrRE_jg4465 [Triparma retinervis]|uniref:Alpha/beta hydrolase fold-3 domain-containing protein n=1 Tax=Triparma retinervis TaxID=2557542 RepID=A0A9W7AX80_9STRA|nr:hypothetical protein TrRE_jg4465 [Triparma retinervis]